MRIAIISDIHANLAALRAVLADTVARRVDQIYCLGDMVGYGPEPEKVVDLAMEFTGAVVGNHEQGLLSGKLSEFRDPVAESLRWTRKRLKPWFPGADANQRWNFLSGLPKTLREGKLLFAHGSPSDPFEYITTPMDARAVIEQDFPDGVQVCFVGHTHEPGFFIESPDGRIAYVPAEERTTYRIQEGFRLLVNVGSVGQPRDDDSRTCYCLYKDDPPRFSYRRLPYSIIETVDAIRGIPELDDEFAQRLLPV